MNPLQRIAKAVGEFFSPPAQAVPQGPLKVDKPDARHGAGHAS